MGDGQVKIQWNKVAKSDQAKVQEQGDAAMKGEEAKDTVVPGMFKSFSAKSLQVGLNFCCNKKVSNTLLRSALKEDYDMYNETMLSPGTSVGSQPYSWCFRCC